MALLITESPNEVAFLKEEVNGERKLYIEGIIMQGDIKNRNGRIYPMAILEKEVDRYVKNYVNENRALGELNHPPHPEINLDRVSHRFTELNVQGNNITGKAIIVNTNMGDIVKGLIESDCKLGISSRGLGSLKPDIDGVLIVQEDFMLTTAGDIVSDPSAPNAFINGIMEGTKWIYDVAASSWRMANTFDRIEETVKKSNKQNKRINEKMAVRLFDNFMKSL